MFVPTEVRQTVKPSTPCAACVTWERFRDVPSRSSTKMGRMLSPFSAGLLAGQPLPRRLADRLQVLEDLGVAAEAAVGGQPPRQAAQGAGPFHEPGGHLADVAAEALGGADQVVQVAAGV